MSETTPEYVERAWAFLARVASLAQRLWSGPNGPLLLGLGLGLAALVEVTIYGDEVDVAVLPNLLATMPLALARKHLPWAAVLVAFGALIAVSEPSSTLTLSGLVVLLVVSYQVAARSRRRWSALLALPFLVNAIAFAGPEAGNGGVFLLVVVVAALALGDARGQRGEAIAERDVTKQAMAEALRDQAALEERARIARELHDIVAHHVSGIAVQAETARLTTPGMPDEGQRRLEAIGATARDALTEMRRLVGVLRADGGDEAERAPQPGLDRLDELIAAAWAAGTYVRLTLQGNVVPLPPGVDLTAYRIVQEALTNARQHAPGANVDVEVRYDADALHLRVRDNGPGRGDADPDGHGLLGMRERTAMVGGSLHTGPADGGGFVVEADLPLAEQDS